MASPETITLYELDIDLNASLKGSEDMRKAVLELKKGLKELTDAEKDNNKAIDEQIKKLNDLKSAENQNVIAVADAEAELDKLITTRDDLNSSIVDQTNVLKVNQKELRQNEQLTQNVVKADEAATGSIEQMRRQLSVVTSQWVKLSKEERENSERGKELTAQKLKLTETLKKEEKATGDTRRNVGNYANDILDAVNSLQKQKEAQTKSIKELEAAKQATAKGSIENKKYSLALIQQQKELKKTDSELSEYTNEIQDAEVVSSDFAGTLGVFGGAGGKAAQGIQLIGTASKVALGPIGIILGIITLITKAVQSFFTSSEEGQNKLRKLQAIAQTVFGNINDVLSSLGEKIVSVFENPKQAIKDLGAFLKDNLVNRFVGLVELIPNIGKAIGKLFKGEFAEAGKIAADSIAKVALGVEDFTDKAVDSFNKSKEALNEFITEQEKEIAVAQQLADRQANLNIARREQSVQLAKNKDEIQQLLLASRDLTNSAEERREAVLKANAIRREEIVLNKQLALENYNIIKSQNELSNSTIEDKEREAEALVRVYELQAENAAQLRELKNREVTLDNEIAAQNKALRDAEIAEKKKAAEEAVSNLEYEFEEWKRLNEDRLSTQAEFNNRELELQNELAAQKLELGVLNQEEYNRALQENQIAFEQAEAERINEQKLLDAENEKILAEEKLFENFDLQLETLEQQRQIEVEAAEKLGADVLLVNQKYAKAENEIEKLKQNAKLSLVAGFANDVATIAGEQSELGKAAAAAATLISTYQGATAAFTGMTTAIPGPVGIGLGVAAAAAAVISGISNVKKIYSVKTPGKGGGGGGGGASGGQPSTPSGIRTVTNVNPEIGQGIASRDDISTQSITDTIEEGETTKSTIVVDSVTDAQEQAETNDSIGEL